MKIYEHPNADLTIHQEGGFVEVTWKGFCYRQELHNLLEQVYRNAVDYQAHALLHDMRSGKVVRPEDQQWMFQSYSKKTKASFIKKVAIVQSENPFNQISGYYIADHLDNNMITQNKIFSSYTAGHELGKSLIRPNYVELKKAKIMAGQQWKPVL